MTPRKSSSKAKPTENATNQKSSDVQKIAVEVRELRESVEKLRQELAAALSEHDSDPSAESLQIDLAPNVIEQVNDWLMENMTTLLQEQLELIVSAQDDMGEEILKAIKGDVATKPRAKKNTLLDQHAISDLRKTTIPPPYWNKPPLSRPRRVVAICLR